jgi:hypothetical protein
LTGSSRREILGALVRRAGWNPTRRNRNIGTAKFGHGLANRLVIPERWREPGRFWEKLRDPVFVEKNGRTVVVEPCLPGWVHAVTVDDIVRMLGLLPAEDIAGIRAVVLRQPTRKQHVLSAVWGRLIYFAEIGRISGPVVILEAQHPEACIAWPRSLRPDGVEEIERLRADGHVVRCDQRWRIQTTLAANRSTQLFRTLPHEVGHHVHHEREVVLPAGGDYDTEDELRDRHFGRPKREREDFAHRYARETMERLSTTGRVPFERCVDEAAIHRWGLAPRWFGLT